MGIQGIIPTRHRQGGQSAVEAALTLPLTVFLLLGTLQLFMVAQGRIMAEYAVVRAARVGMVHGARCAPMLDAAVVALMPTFAATYDARSLVAAYNLYEQRQKNKYPGGSDIVWIDRLSPKPANLPANIQSTFDVPLPNFRFGGGANLNNWDAALELDIRMTFWYPLRIPFANWVFSRIALAQLGGAAYTGYNPLMPTTDASWQQVTPGGTSVQATVPNLKATFVSRVQGGEYVFPIVVATATRLMTPPNGADLSRVRQSVPGRCD